MERQARSKTINNDFYDKLHDRWHSDCDHPIALLRAENAVRIPWIIDKIGSTSSTVLDIGCGAGLLTNALAKVGHTVSGIDLSPSSLTIAKKYDETNSVTYKVANAYSLPFEDQSFDVVCAMDVLEHVEEPSLLIAEASRVLKSNGLFFFHTFNRNLFSYIVIIKGVEWCVRNTPKNMHVYPLFIKPSELQDTCETYNLKVEHVTGLIPQVNRSFFEMIFTRKVPKDFRFCFSKSLLTGYCGIARKGDLYSAR
jgi:2-polyprenyl-6-hydroxyphenyl methylase / 3-demethylubiquinone-9 3-methyltransferase